MVYNEAAATALATVGTVCWCIQLIPQIIHNYIKKDCTGLPPSMLFLWVFSSIPFAIYFCIINTNTALEVQPHLFMFFCSLSLIQCCYYPPVKMNRMKILYVVGGLILFAIGSEVGFIVWLRPLYARGIHWPATIFGIVASVLLAIGLLPPYYEIYKRNGRVVGINFIFLAIDSLGSYLSIASVAVGTFDTLGIVIYCIIAGLELGIFLSHFIWCCRFKWFGNDKYFVDDTVAEEKDTTENGSSYQEAENEPYFDESNPLNESLKKQDQDKSTTYELPESNHNYENEKKQEDTEEPTKAGFSTIFDSKWIRSIHGVSLHRNKKSTSNHEQHELEVND